MTDPDDSAADSADDRTDDRTDSRRRTVVAIASAAVVVVLVAAWTIHLVTRRAPDLAATNSRVLISGVALEIDPGTERCQDQDWVPAEATTARLFADPGPTGVGGPFRVLFEHRDGSVVFTADVAAGWDAGPLTVPVHPPTTVDPARICIHNDGTQTISFAGNLTLPNAVDPSAKLRGFEIAMTQRDPFGAIRGDDIRIDFFTDHPGTFFSSASQIAARFALYKPHLFGDALLYVVLGAFVVLAALAIAYTILAARSTVRLRTLLVVVAVVAIGHAWVWAFTTPPDQVPDEGVHTAYVDYLAAKHTLPPLQPKPTPAGATLPGYNLLFDSVPFSLTEPTNWSKARDNELRNSLDHLPYATNEGAPGSAAPYPPLYYAYEAVPARVLQPLDALDRFFVLRMWSALLFGATAVGVLLFLREVFPSRPWTWAVGAFAVALQPVAAFMGGGVNNDNLLYALSAGLLALTARAMRRGIDRTSAWGLAGLAFAGILTKPSIAMLFPGIVVGLVVAHRRHRRPLRPVAEATVVTTVALAVWVAIAKVWGGRSPSQALGLSGGTELSARAGPVGIRRQLSYFWQYFLPRLPNMTPAVDYLHYPVYDVYWRGLVGVYGFFAYGFSYRVLKLALVPAAAVVALAVWTLVRERARVRARLGEVVTYAIVAVGTLAFMASVGVRQLVATDLPFEQTRYLFPLLALYGAGIALAAARRRFVVVVGPAVVALAAAQAWFGLLLTVRHYYA